MAGMDRWGKSYPTGIRSPDRPARSESLYRLNYPGPVQLYCIESQFHYLILYYHNTVCYICCVLITW
jgi:hypothetical protein